MNNYSALNIVIIGLFSLFPLSLIIINIFTRIANKVDVNFSNISTILTSVRGVLTNNILSVKHVIFDHFEFESQEENNLLHIFNEQSKTEMRIEKKHLEKIEGIKMLAIITNLCHYEKTSKLEEIISNFFKGCGISPFQIKADYEIIEKIASGEIKKISSVVAIKKDTQEIFSLSKGNPIQILERCTRIFLNGKKVELNQQMKRKIRKKIEKINKHGEKIIAFAYKGLPIKRLEKYTEQFTENDLVFAGMVSLTEKINYDLLDIIEEAKNNKIKFYIVSHVKEREALSCAIELKIVNPHYFETITGNDFAQINDQKLLKIFANREKDYIFCELKNKDKEKIFETLKKSGEIFAIAQKKGSSISEILHHIKAGKAHGVNSEKLVFHALALRIALITSLLINLALGLSPALNILGIIFLEIINIPLELSLRAEPDSIENPTNNHKTNYIHLFVNGVIYGIIISGIYIFSLLRFGWIPFTEGLNLSDSAFTTSLSLSTTAAILLQILNAYNIRNPQKSIFKSKIFSNLYLLISSISIMLLFYIVSHFEDLSEYLGLQPLNSGEWQIVIFLCTIIVAMEELRKFLLKPKNNAV